MDQAVTDKIDWLGGTRGDRVGVISYLFIGSAIKYHIKIFEAPLGDLGTIPIELKGS